MAPRKTNKGKGKRTSMWLSEAVLKASAKKAQKLGISRTLYFQQLLRKDLGMEGIGLDEETPAAPPSVFG